MTGRPLKYKTPEDLENAINDYFDNTEKVTLSGLAVHLGIGRRTLYEYNDREAFSHIIKGAREKVEAAYEERLVYSSQPTGVIFALKNMDWRDKHETEHSGEINLPTIKVEVVKPNEGK
jgi:hypothetical protein